MPGGSDRGDRGSLPAVRRPQAPSCAPFARRCARTGGLPLSPAPVKSVPAAPVAQWIEHPPPKGRVARSIRAGGAIDPGPAHAGPFFARTGKVSPLRRTPVDHVQSPRQIRGRAIHRGPLPELLSCRAHAPDQAQPADAPAGQHHASLLLPGLRSALLQAAPLDAAAFARPGLKGMMATAARSRSSIQASKTSSGTGRWIR